MPLLSRNQPTRGHRQLSWLPFRLLETRAREPTLDFKASYLSHVPLTSDPAHSIGDTAHPGCNTPGGC